MESSISDNVLSQELLYWMCSNIKSICITDIVALALASLIAGAYCLRGIAWDKPDPFYHVYFERPQQQDGGGGSRDSLQTNIAHKLGESDKKAVIFWGSQSGTAERFANQLAKECHSRFNLDTLSADLSDYDPSSIAELAGSHIIIFILSTYGEGDPSDNAGGFWNWIHSASDISLSHIRYTAFGLGNSNYKYYNRVVDVVVAQLDRLGAKLSLPVGKADEAQRSTEEDFITWKIELFNMFRRDLQLHENSVVFKPTFTITEDPSLRSSDLNHGEPTHSKNNPLTATTCSAIQALSVKNPRELFNSSERNCVHVELDLSDHPEIHYKTGDHLAVWPSNPENEVNLLLSALGLSDRQNIPISLIPIDPSVKLQLPTPTTYQTLFRHYLEICAPVSRATVQGLAPFAPTSEAKSMIVQLGADKASYAQYLARTQLTFGRLLRITSPSQPWTTLPLSYLLETIATLQPRYYSISSSSVLSPRKAAITALVAADLLPGNPNQRIHGVTSNYLLALSRTQQNNSILVTDQQGENDLKYDLAGPSGLLQRSKVFAHVRKSKFKLPIQSSCPIVMVAAGTGVAPFRAFIAERAKLYAIGKPIGDMLLFFGCRKPDEDYIYRDELQQIQESLPEGKLRIVTAFSRSTDGQGKIYVQQRVREHGSQLFSLLEEQSANFYICGRASMAREVGIGLCEIVQSMKCWNDAEVKSWSEALKRRGKWREDVWG